MSDPIFREQARVVSKLLTDLENTKSAETNGDLISRQEAITFIKSLYPEMPVMPMNRKWWKEKYKQFIAVEAELRNLPSAEPKRHLTCKNCIHLGHSYMMPCKNCKRNQMLPDWYEERKI